MSGRLFCPPPLDLAASGQLTCAGRLCLQCCGQLHGEPGRGDRQGTAPHLAEDQVARRQVAFRDRAQHQPVIVKAGQPDRDLEPGDLLVQDIEADQLEAVGFDHRGDAA